MCKKPYFCPDFVKTTSGLRFHKVLFYFNNLGSCLNEALFRFKKQKNDWKQEVLFFRLQFGGEIP